MEESDGHIRIFPVWEKINKGNSSSKMTIRCNNNNAADEDDGEEEEESGFTYLSRGDEVMETQTQRNSAIIVCPSCGHQYYLQSKHHQNQGFGIEDWSALPAGVKFDPTDEQIIQHLEAKVLMNKCINNNNNNNNNQLLHPLINQFIPTLDGDDGICYTHPQNLPGMSKDGEMRHFFHRPSKAYTTGKRKRRKVHTQKEDEIETRWHKTGKTRPIIVTGGILKGFKKILVLYTNYGRQKKPQKTNWVMHQYHLGNTQDEKDGELVASKIFFQKQPRRHSHSATATPHDQNIVKVSSAAPSTTITTLKNNGCDIPKSSAIIDYYKSTFITYEYRHESQSQSTESSSHNLVIEDTSK